MNKLRKLAGGVYLDCGHQQHVSELRIRVASEGKEQKPVWCIECENWSRLAPKNISENTLDKSE